MQFRTYTYRGLEKRLHQELNNEVKDFDLIKRINEELKERTLLKLPQMCPKEIIHWILEDTNFERIAAIINMTTDTNYVLEKYSHHRVPTGKVTINGLMIEAGNLLRDVVQDSEHDYPNTSRTRGGWTAERNIYDGVMTLKLYYSIGGYDMDYDSVTSDNWCEEEEKYKGELDD